MINVMGAQVQTGWAASAKRFARAVREDALTDWAAALTYYAVLSIFPALLALISVVGLLGRSATEPLLDNLTRVAPGPARDLVTSVIVDLESTKGTAGVLLVAGLAAALWSASGFVGAFMRATNAIYGVQESRPFWRTLPVRLATTFGLLVMLAVVAVGVTVTGGLARATGDLLGLGPEAVRLWELAKWPAILVVVMLMVAILYWVAPDVQHRFRWVTPGAALGVLLWLASSAGFAYYVAHFGSYNRTYGALGGVIVFLVWLWVSNLALLLGAEVDAEITHHAQGDLVADDH